MSIRSCMICDQPACDQVFDPGRNKGGGGKHVSRRAAAAGWVSISINGVFTNQCPEHATVSMVTA